MKLKDVNIDPIDKDEDKFKDCLLQDIIAVKGILYKFNLEHIFQDKQMFVCFLNELGFKTRFSTPISVNYLVSLYVNKKELINKGMKEQINSFD